VKPDDDSQMSEDISGGNARVALNFCVSAALFTCASSSFFHHPCGAEQIDLQLARNMSSRQLMRAL